MSIVNILKNKILKLSDFLIINRIKNYKYISTNQFSQTITFSLKNFGTEVYFILENENWLLHCRF